MGEEEPEAKDRLGEDVKNSVRHDLSIETNETATIGNTPDTFNQLVLVQASSEAHSHWVDCPQDQSEAGNGTVESLGLAVLASNSGTAVEGKLIDNDQVGEASPAVPAPFLTVRVTESSEETGKDHDEISHNSNQNVGAAKTGKESKIKQKEWGGDAPVDVSCPVDLAVDDLVCVWDMLVLFNLDNLVVADSVTGGHGKVGKEGEGGDESCQDMEETFLLSKSARSRAGSGERLTAGTLNAMP
jgi:hypothetical protein